MKILAFAVVLAAAAISSQAPAQDGADGRQITRQEAQQMADSMFLRFDANHDGVVTRDEAQQAIGQFSQGSEGHGASRAQRMIDRIFGTSQTVTKQQFGAVALSRFDKQDSNHDGVISAAERQQAKPSRQSAQ